MSKSALAETEQGYSDPVWHTIPVTLKSPIFGQHFDVCAYFQEELWSPNYCKPDFINFAFRCHLRPSCITYYTRSMHLFLSVHHIVDSDGSSAFSVFGRRLDAVQWNREAMANSPHNRIASIIPNIRRILRIASFLRLSFGRKRTREECIHVTNWLYWKSIHLDKKKCRGFLILLGRRVTLQV